MPLAARRGLVAAVVGIGLCCLPSSASAQVKPDFERHYRAAERAYNLGEYDQARAEFEAARKVQDLPGPYRWLAQVAKVQERYEDCLTEAKGYLQKSPTGKWTQTVRDLHETCRKGLGRAEFRGDMGAGGAIAITSNTEGATVRLNGLKYGATPMEPRAVAVGNVDIELSAERYLSRAVRAEIIEGLVTDVHVELDLDPNAAPDPVFTDAQKEVKIGWVIFAISTPNATVTIDGKPVALDETGRFETAPATYEVVVTAAGYEPWRRRVRVLRGQERTVAATLREQASVEGYRRWGYVALGVAAATAGTGMLFSLKEQSAREEARDLWEVEIRRQPPPQDTFEDVVPIRTRDDLETVIDDAKKWRNLSYAAYGAAAVAFGASVYFFLKERRPDREGFPLPLAITPVPDEQGGLAGVGATFTTEIDW